MKLHEIFAGVVEGRFEVGTEFKTERGSVIKVDRNGLQEKGLFHKHNGSAVRMLADEIGKADFTKVSVFKKGDWIMTEAGTIGQLTEVTGGRLYSDLFHNEKVGRTKRNDWVSETNARKATPAEIAKEERRRSFDKFGRQVNEFQIGDLVKIEGLDGTYEVEHVFKSWKEVRVFGNSRDFDRERATLVMPIERLK